MPNVIAIDLGGTKTAVAVFDSTGSVLDRAVVATTSRPPAVTVNDLVALAQRLKGQEAAGAVAMAMPAIIGTEGVVSWAARSVQEWAGASVSTLLSAAFGLPAGAMFDGYAATLGEATFGAGKGLASVATLIVGTGFGAGVWLDGRVVEGYRGVAGAVGWNRWPVEGGLSAPAEAVASGPGILAAARRLGREEDYPDTHSVFDRAEAGDQAAGTAVDQAVAVAGTVAGNIIDLLAPELVVWSGGVGSRVDFSDRATGIAQQSCQPYASSRTTFTRSRLGAESSLVGAAARALSIAKGEVQE